MKVVVVGPYPEPGAVICGGVERVIDTLLPELSRLVDLTLVVPGSRANGFYESRGVPTIYLRRGRGPGTLNYWTRDARALSTVVRELQPDIIHLHAAAGVGRLSRAPKVLTVHGIAHRDMLLSHRSHGYGAIARKTAAQILRYVEQYSRELLAGIIVINPYVLEALPDILSRRHVSIPNPVDARFLVNLPDPASLRLRKLIAVGRIGPLKNTARIIEIAVSVMQSDPHCSLSICGTPADNDYMDCCNNILRKSGCASNVKIAGNKETGELVKELNSASVLLMASLQENAPMAIAEAHARGVAVVAPRAFGIKYMIKPGQNGFFLPDGSIEEQARVVRAALEHPWDRASIAAEARMTYAPRRIAEQTVAMYREILATRRT